MNDPVLDNTHQTYTPASSRKYFIFRDRKYFTSTNIITITHALWLVIKPWIHSSTYLIVVIEKSSYYHIIDFDTKYLIFVNFMEN